MFLNRNISEWNINNALEKIDNTEYEKNATLSWRKNMFSSLRRPPGYNLMEALNGACRQSWEGFQLS